MQNSLYIYIVLGMVWQGVAGTQQPPAIADRDGQQGRDAPTAVKENREEIEGRLN